MRLFKMHGIGNDYVYADCMKETLRDPEKLAVRISDRHFGVGGDGLILICPSDSADCFMKMYNNDGSEGKMCGNGIRCVAKFMYDNGYVTEPFVDVETLSGIKHINLTVKDGKCESATVDMGVPEIKKAAVKAGRKTPLLAVNSPTVTVSPDVRIAEPSAARQSAEPLFEEDVYALNAILGIE